MSDYNGWSNYETWNCNLWLDNDQGTQEMVAEWARECLQDATDTEAAAEVQSAAVTTLARRIEDMIDEGMPEVSGVYADLLGAAVQAIDFREIAQNLLEGVRL